ncbi:hypothetical protein E2C01_005198 [Portunus trituberculatus]|uniref:Uncharacterized protein n=1 Tax=Portunus trituberculatus TaxID=210409 RepID=A0A5B7CSP8_PORTR|nr:hypothetical protein [Portunus trituberculatus]
MVCVAGQHVNRTPRDVLCSLNGPCTVTLRHRAGGAAFRRRAYMVRNNNGSASPAWPYGAWDTGPHLAGLPRDGGSDALLGFLSAFTVSRQQQGTREHSCAP